MSLIRMQMKKKVDKMSDIFEITENPLPVHGWTARDRFDRLGVIEQEVQNLMRKLAETEFSLSEQGQEYKAKTKNMLLALLEVMDAFERMFGIIESKKDQITEKTKRLVGNFRTIYRILQKILSKQAVSPIENLDKGFDPRWHKAVETISDPSKPNGTIVEERQTGYVWQNQILRETEVVVIRNST